MGSAPPSQRQWPTLLIIIFGLFCSVFVVYFLPSRNPIVKCKGNAAFSWTQPPALHSLLSKFEELKFTATRGPALLASKRISKPLSCRASHCFLLGCCLAHSVSSIGDKGGSGSGSERKLSYQHPHHHHCFHHFFEDHPDVLLLLDLEENHFLENHHDHDVLLLPDVEEKPFLLKNHHDHDILLLLDVELSQFRNCLAKQLKTQAVGGAVAGSD